MIGPPLQGSGDREPNLTRSSELSVLVFGRFGSEASEASIACVSRQQLEALARPCRANARIIRHDEGYRRRGDNAAVSR